MAAPCGSELPANSPLKIPKMEVLSPASPGGLSDGNPSLSDPSTPRGASPLGPGSAAGSGAAASGGLGLGLGGRSAASSSVSFSPGGGGGGAAAAAAAACRGMSWTPAETNALIAVWGNERLVEARYQQLEGAGTVFGSKAPGPAMYERVSRALAELGYERTPSQCRERIKIMWLQSLLSNTSTAREAPSTMPAPGMGNLQVDERRLEDTELVRCPELNAVLQLWPHRC
ncbi:myb/SANT-like DNA-binding domain-containing protein 2 isoform X3 [Equus quagga]|nr:myb/SANT-like DNA-binding domain-containing protein 2 isoform X5 [Equus asinus]XP_023500834.1 myb/SANT-like DNA-binding domain-containing protein 2 isoform X5 [Equus caballus]XP_023500835.1 myb/SANT-like DNA-binding domain-containing protein 2 isoform X5 [Equus caballus]XP_023500836.1 myb/SANT-like DNA-binding domain-containing protein 2 isoform X5 [Equus caballus]XP_046541894.1 myb/SANT-like DNA-binding domain-containing protein 2 isoform X3 [Equus quagga]XP_046541895.1 myb/SANT-like DNA-b